MKGRFPAHRHLTVNPIPGRCLMQRVPVGFSAVGYQFAQLLQRKLKVPVDMIMASRGGTKIEAWMSENSLRSFPGIKIPAIGDTSKMIKNGPAVLFNAMVHPFLGYGIKGVIWYQGEANRSNAKIYDQLMVSMVREWRNLWHRGDFLFIMCRSLPSGIRIHWPAW